MDKEGLYQERLDRVTRAYRLQPVDRVPLAYLGPAHAPVFMGMPLSKYCNDADAAIQVTIEAMERLGDVDVCNNMPSGLHPCHLTNMWLSEVAWPGIELPEDEIWQVREKEVMTTDDYDFIVDKGWQAFVENFIPKVAKMDKLQEHFTWLDNNYAGIPKRFRDAGYPILSSCIVTIPFEIFCGGRSLRQFFLDLYRIPDKVQAAMDVVLPQQIELGKLLTSACGVKGLWVGGWRAASAMLAPKIWDRFVFPYYHELVTQLTDDGIFCILHWDQDWTRDLERLKELPAKKFALSPDGSTDIRKAKEILGDHMCILGDVPPSILSAGTPDDVYNYIQALIRDVGPTGLIMNSGCDMPHTTPDENIEAYVAATREYGKC